MTIFELDRDALRKLSAGQLEELVARLAEAELAAHGHSPSHVYWGGSTQSPDGGVDVRVKVPVAEWNTGFLSKPNTIFQVKTSAMPKGDISSEMCKGGALLPAIREQASRGGSYVIVSLGDDCSDAMMTSRLDAMREAVGGHPDKDKIDLDFIDRSRLHSWLRQHPGVMLWAREAVGQPLNGWRPYGAWSNTPAGMDDSLISAPGVSITLPSGHGERLSIAEAIDPMRKLVRSSGKAVRITGLSGVGKTRIVQALFDESLGEDALDRAIAVYTDTGSGPDPSANEMLNRLITENRRAVMVVDNCPPDIHSELASSSSKAPQISLITVEYDIKDDQPQLTDVIHIEAEGTEVAEKLSLRRYPEIGQVNARRIAKFADGNARVALALAERVEGDKSLAHLSDRQLFKRLFEQRNRPDGKLEADARVLALVYSFSVEAAKPAAGLNEANGEKIDELAVLASLNDVGRKQLYGSAAELLSRGIAQKRSHWRAILPQAIANRLAGEALKSVPVEDLRTTFEARGRTRLLKSFARRLGMMHDHPVAQEIVNAWLQKDGLLGGRLLNLDDTGVQMLRYVAPVAPDSILDRIEAEISGGDHQSTDFKPHPHRTTMLSLLQSLAYEANAFERCIDLLVADYESARGDDDSLRELIATFFQPVLSGTHASLEQRLAVVRATLRSQSATSRSLGFGMLSSALKSFFSGMAAHDFGARPRGYGFQPDGDQLALWRKQFIGLAVEMGLQDDPGLAERATVVLAEAFRGLWVHQAIREQLVKAARDLHTKAPWIEGWKAVRSTIYFDYRETKPGKVTKPIPQSLAALEDELAPRGLMAEIRAYVLSQGSHPWVLDEAFDDRDDESSLRRIAAKVEKLGEAYAGLDQPIWALGSALYVNDDRLYLEAFGRGLARGAVEPRKTWEALVEQLHQHCEFGQFIPRVLCGFIEEFDNRDRRVAQALLDQCADDRLLKTVLPWLHPAASFDAHDLKRCASVLEERGVQLSWYGNFLRCDCYRELPPERLHDLAERLLEQPSGEEVVLEALSMRLGGANAAEDVLPSEFRRIGLMAATKLFESAVRLLRSSCNGLPDEPVSSNVLGMMHDCAGLLSRQDDSMARVVGAALPFDGHDEHKEALMDAIFSLLDKEFGLLSSCDRTIQTVASMAPEVFLSRVFSGDKEARDFRRRFIRDARGRPGREKPLLADVSMEVLIGWCKRQNDPAVWPLVGSIALWAQAMRDDTGALAEGVISFLQAAPDVEAVLNAYAYESTTEPNAYVVGGVIVFQQRVAAIAPLREHPDPKLAAAAKSVHASAQAYFEM